MYLAACTERVIIRIPNHVGNSPVAETTDDRRPTSSSGLPTFERLSITPSVKFSGAGLCGKERSVAFKELSKFSSAAQCLHFPICSDSDREILSSRLFSTYSLSNL
jgi:hypothetical protein